MENKKRIPRLVLAGQFQQGKSTFINCLLKGRYAIEGERTRTTSGVIRYVYSKGGFRVCSVDASGRRRVLPGGLSETIKSCANSKDIEAGVPSEVLKLFEVHDTPGWGVDKLDDKIAARSIEDATFVIYVVSRSLDEADCAFLRLIQKKRKYFSILLNCQNKENPSPDEDCQKDVCKAILGALKQRGLHRFLIRYPSGLGVAAANLKWAKYAIGLLDDPQTENEQNQLDEVINKRKELKDIAGDKVAALSESRFEDVATFACHAIKLISEIREED